MDPTGLCTVSGEGQLYAGPCATTGAGALKAEAGIQAQGEGGGFSFTNGFKALADYGAGIGNAAVSTITLGHVHISAPYCGFGYASDVGGVFGTALTFVLGGEAVGAVSDVLRGAETVEVAEAAAQAGAASPELAAPETVNNAAGPIRSFVTSQDMTFVRVFSGGNAVGGFLAGSVPESADAAVAGFALPPENTADFIQDVLIPAGTRLQSSIAGEAFGQPGGLLQFELLDEVPVKNFGPGVPFR